MNAFFDKTLMASPTPTRELAAWCQRLDAETLPEPVALAAARHTLDTLAACAAGMGRPLVQAAITLERRINPNQGSIPLFGGPQHWTLLEAAGLMATACHALEMDDGNREGSIHPGTVVIPAALALAWERNVNYPTLLKAVVAGYEVAVSVAEALHPHASRRGFQTTPTAGVLGAAAACGTILALDAEAMESALGIAASASSGIFAYLSGGGNVKKFHPAHAAREGLRAALMAQDGLAQGPMGVIETPSGILQAIGGLTGWDGSLARPRARTAIERSYLKPYPCCRHIHPAIDAALALRQDNWDAQQITAIEVETYQAAMPHATLPWHSLEIAQLSFPWVMALACADGEVTLAGFSEAARERADLNALAARVQVSRSDDCDALYPQYGPAKVTIVLTSGERLSTFVEDPLGSADLPLSDAMLDQKSREAFETVFSAERARGLIQRLRTLDNWPLSALLHN